MRATLMQKVYRPLTSALDMRRIVNQTDVPDFSVFHLDEGKYVTVTEVS
jgi:hypothetical protein